MILVVDNYDSFTFNLVQLLGELGAEVSVYRNDEISAPEARALEPAAVVLSPGPGEPGEAGVTVEIVHELGAAVPILGVCLGHQAIGLAYGGQVVPAPELLHGKASPVYHHGRGLYRGLTSPFPAGRYHSLLVERETLPACLRITARTGEGRIMGLRHRRLPVEGVQFHPESVLTPQGGRLLANFLEDVQERRPAAVRAGGGER